MQFTTLTFCVLAALSTVTAAPAADSLEQRWGFSIHKPVWKDSLLDFVRRETGSGAKCNLREANMPAAPVPLPPPTAGLVLSHVALGRGTQNYTCDTTNATAVPAAVGAVAKLFNVSCLAVDSPALLDRLSVIALNLPTPSENNDVATRDLSGHHYFTDLTTAYFDLDTSLHQYGEGAFKKVNATAAPAGASVGQGNKGNGAVPWLKLISKSGPSQTLQEVYRLNTAGGQPPKTCAGQPASFQIEYAAEYWIWSK